MNACNRKIKLERLLEGIDYNIIQGGTDRETGSIHYNTKDVMPGGVFVCIKGFHTDSHKLVKEAVYNGVTNLRYIDRILSEWTKKGIKTKEDLEKEKIEFSKRKIQNNSVNKQNIDYDWLNEE